jgi:hypothetical protein
MKCASIDIGTNTKLLLIGKVGRYMQEIVDISTITRLGGGVCAMESSLSILFITNSMYVSRSLLDKLKLSIDLF